VPWEARTRCGAANMMSPDRPPAPSEGVTPAPGAHGTALGLLVQSPSPGCRPCAPALSVRPAVEPPRAERSLGERLPEECWRGCARRRAFMTPSSEVASGHGATHDCPAARRGAPERQVGRQRAEGCQCYVAMWLKCFATPPSVMVLARRDRDENSGGDSLCILKMEPQTRFEAALRRSLATLVDAVRALSQDPAVVNMMKRLYLDSADADVTRRRGRHAFRCGARI
jgi:hypothetical protein